MMDDLIYEERVSSTRTEVFFLALTVIFLLLLIWRVDVGGLDFLSIISFCFFSLFLFYLLNYRILTIHLTHESLKLIFGIFTWTIPVENIQKCSLDELPLIMKYGGAGIHFMFIGKRYRASFNFLEYPRVVIAFERKVGHVRDISFSTRQPDDILRFIHQATSAKIADVHIHSIEDAASW